jgi:probable rRNA maturation factor
VTDEPAGQRDEMGPGADWRQAPDPVSEGSTAAESAETEEAQRPRRSRRPRRRRSAGDAPTGVQPESPEDLAGAPADDEPGSADQTGEPVLGVIEGAPSEVIAAPLASDDAGGGEPIAPGDDEEADAEPVAAAPRAPAARRGRAASGPVAVNVVVPRGLGRRVNSKLIQQATSLALRREGWDQPATLDVVIVDDEEMRAINVSRRGIDEATDVLSFPMLELRPETGLAEDFFVLPPETQVHLGDVVISFPRVESQADEAGHSRERELAFLTVHAVLHILGYDHDTEEKRRYMRRREEDVLVELGLRRNGS